MVRLLLPLLFFGLCAGANAVESTATYKLTWKVQSFEHTICPDYKPNPYTGQMPTTICAVYHSTVVTRNMEKEFDFIEALEAFKSSAPANCYDFKVEVFPLINGASITVSSEYPKITWGENQYCVKLSTTPTGNPKYFTWYPCEKAVQHGYRDDGFVVWRSTR